MKQYSIAEAKDQLPRIVRNVETLGRVELTRRGKPVAVLLSTAEFERLKEPPRDFWAAYQEWLKRRDPDVVITDEDFEGLRDKSPGRDFEW